ncbi:MAG: DUF3052 domain-containing protein [Propionibacteriaceae bacterium]
MTAGYSGTPLVQKLGIKTGMRVAVLSAPTGFLDTLVPLPEELSLVTRLVGHRDLVLVFVVHRTELVRRLAALTSAIAPDGMIWVAWPKKASAKKEPYLGSDMTEDVVREVALPTGLVDVKVCAVDEIWSGLKLVIRRELR